MTRMLVVECPGWPVDDARAFESVVAAVESFTPRVEIGRPGLCTFATRGPSRYFGGDDALAARVADAVDGVLPPGSGACRVGVADGRFAAERAARLNVRVPPGRSAAFLAPFPVSTLPGDDLAHLLRRLGIATLGDLARLPAGAVLARFGVEGRQAHRLARGLDELPLAARVPPPDLVVTVELDPPVVQVETVAFAAKSLADQLADRLARRGLAVTSVAVEAETEHGEHLSRLWRHDRGLTAAALAQRVRWQLDGWFQGPSGPSERGEEGPSGGITLLRLVPDEVCPDRGRQLGFWGDRGREGEERASRALARVQATLGHETVMTAVVEGGRGPADRIRLMPWGPSGPSERGSQRDAPQPGAGECEPWPGAIPPPAPATVHPRPVPAEVVDAAGTRVTVTGRGRASAEPARLQVGRGSWAEVEAWAGPWPLDERWWDPPARQRRARWQMVTADGSAHLLTVEGGRWWVEATYD